MSIEFLKDLKYLNTVFEVTDKNNPLKEIYVYISVDGNELKIINDDFIVNNGACEIRDPENYTITDPEELNNLGEVLCDLCEKKDATLIKNDHIYCDDCITLERIDHNVYKFRTNEELKKLMYAFNDDERFYDAFETYQKGLYIVQHDPNYENHYHTQAIKAELIGEF